MTEILNKVFSIRYDGVRPYSFRIINRYKFSLANATDTVNIISGTTSRSGKIIELNYVGMDYSFLPKYSPLRKIVIFDYELILMVIGNLGTLEKASALREKLYHNSTMNLDRNATLFNKSRDIEFTMQLQGKKGFTGRITVESGRE